jgi:hypothetical protein
MRFFSAAVLVSVAACTGSLEATDEGGAPPSPASDAGGPSLPPPPGPAPDASTGPTPDSSSPGDAASPDASPPLDASAPPDAGPHDSGAPDAAPPSTECGSDVPFEIPIDPAVCTTLAVGPLETRIAQLRLGQSRALIKLGATVNLPGAGNVFSLGLSGGFLYTCSAGFVARVTLTDGAVEATDLGCDVVTADPAGIWVQSAERGALERYADHAAVVAHTPASTYAVIASTRLASRGDLFAYSDKKSAWRIDPPTGNISIPRLGIAPATPMEINGLAMAPNAQLFMVSSQWSGNGNGIFDFGTIYEPGFVGTTHLTRCPAYTMHGLACE